MAVNIRSREFIRKDAFEANGLVPLFLQANDLILHGDEPARINDCRWEPNEREYFFKLFYVDTDISSVLIPLRVAGKVLTFKSDPIPHITFNRKPKQTI